MPSQPRLPAVISSQARRVLDAILRLEARLGRRPLQQEIAIEAGFRSRSSANKYIGELERAGRLRRDYLSPTTLQATPAS